MKKRDDIDVGYFKDRLTQELALVESELSRVGRINPDNPKDWEPVPEPMETDTAESGEVAERIELFEENSAILNDLEFRFNEIKAALERIDKEEYGFCDECGMPVEEERLVAEEAARTCRVHM